MVLEDQVGPVDLGIDLWHLLQRMDYGLYEKAHEAQLHAVPFFEDVLVLAADRHNGAQVHLIEGGQHGRRVLGFFEPARDSLAQAGHLDPLLTLVDRTRRGWRNGWHRCLGAGLEGRQRIALGHPAVLAGAGDRGG